MIPFIEVLKRAQSGPFCKPREWDMKVIYEKVRNTLNEHGLKGTYDPQNPVNTDDGLADEFFKAAFNLALEVGMYCIDTQRMIKFSEEELKEAIYEAVESVTIGKYPDEAFLRARKPEDEVLPTAFFGPFGLPIDENLWIPIHQSTAQYRVVDALVPGTLERLYGVEIRAGTPIETLAGKYEAVLTKEAVRRAGRPNMGLSGPETSPTEFGHFGGYGVPGGYEATDVNIVLAVAELKTDYARLHKVAHILNLGAPICSGHESMVGGFPETPEGATLVSIAAVILEIVVLQATIPGGNPFDVRFSCNTSRETIWADSVSGQAQSKHLTRPLVASLSTLAGPCTDMLLYECTAKGVSVVVSGHSLLWGVRSSGGIYKNYGTGLENKFAAEVTKASAGMKRSDANEIVKEILPKYESKLKNPPKGKNFLECYDPTTLKPSEEWATIYNRVRKELIDLGVPLQKR